MSNKLALPAAIFSDHKLSLRDIRVMAAISQMTGRAGSCQVSRDEIANTAGVFPHYVSIATSRLLDRGWLDKDTTQRPVIYIINWDNVAPKECYQSGNTNDNNSVTEVVTLSGDGVTKVVTLNDQNSDDSVTKVVTLSAHSVTESVTLNTDDRDNSVTEVVTLSGDSVTKSVTLTEAPNSIYINNILHTSDLIRSDSDARVIHSMIDVLIQFGMPVRFLKEKTDRDLILSWHKYGVTVDDIRNACQRAADASGTIGPRYINSVLRSLKILKSGGDHAAGDEVTAKSLGFATIANTG